MMVASGFSDNLKIRHLHAATTFLLFVGRILGILWKCGHGVIGTKILKSHLCCCSTVAFPLHPHPLRPLPSTSSLTGLQCKSPQIRAPGGHLEAVIFGPPKGGYYLASTPKFSLTKTIFLSKMGGCYLEARFGPSRGGCYLAGGRF